MLNSSFHSKTDIFINLVLGFDSYILYYYKNCEQEANDRQLMTFYRQGEKGHYYNYSERTEKVLAAV